MKIKRPEKIRISNAIDSVVRSKAMVNKVINGSVGDVKKIIDGCEKLKSEEVRNIAQQIPIDEINRNKLGFKINLLKRNGINSIYTLHERGAERVSCIYGISEDSAFRMCSMAANMINSISRGVKVRINPEKRSTISDSVIAECTKILEAEPLQRKAKEIYTEFTDVFETELSHAKKLNNWLSWAFTSELEKVSRIQSLERLEEAVKNGLDKKADAIAEEYEKLLSDKTIAERGWDNFRKNAATYYALIGKCTGVGIEETQQGNLPKNIAETVDQTELCTDGLYAILRAYQEFGTKYILSQKRVLLGDEMGLGKTVQAIAAMNHLASEGKNHFMVVCPLSILVNWTREIKRFSNLKVVPFRGASNTVIDDWIKNGGVAITNYESASRFGLPAGMSLDLLVVDEAHFVKNPNAKRTQAIVKTAATSERVLFMTGTPLENRLDEMIFLISILKPAIAKQVSEKKYMYAADSFKNAIAPVYLRRIRDDVLTELPDKIEMEDWCELGSDEKTRYIDTLMEKNYMLIRRVSWNSYDPASSSKLARLKEICDEAKEENKKVVVFSFFLETMDLILSNLSNECYGPINGTVSTVKRQKILDEFDNAPGGSVLVAQINTAGVGLNIQAASIVVICEPQWKPSTEDQAISRAYRMGQVNNVIVHRLLATDTIDERMMDRLKKKSELFNVYAEESAIEEQSRAIIDNNVMAQLVEEEIAKYNGITKDNTESRKEWVEEEKAEEKVFPKSVDMTAKAEETESVAKVSFIDPRRDIVSNVSHIAKKNEKPKEFERIVTHKQSKVRPGDEEWEMEFNKLKDRYRSKPFEGTLTQLKSENTDIKWKYIEFYSSKYGRTNNTPKKLLVAENIIAGKNSTRERSVAPAKSNKTRQNTVTVQPSKLKWTEKKLENFFSKQWFPGEFNTKKVIPRVGTPIDFVCNDFLNPFSLPNESKQLKKAMQRIQSIVDSSFNDDYIVFYIETKNMKKETLAVFEYLSKFAISKEKIRMQSFVEDDFESQYDVLRIKVSTSNKNLVSIMLQNTESLWHFPIFGKSWDDITDYVSIKDRNIARKLIALGYFDDVEEISSFLLGAWQELYFRYCSLLEIYTDKYFPGYSKGRNETYEKYIDMFLELEEMALEGTLPAAEQVTNV